jgi:hypothetical protein
LGIGACDFFVAPTPMQALTVRASMTPRLPLFLLLLSCASAARADDSFTGALSPADFQAAGLGKLTPAELAKLDLLVRGQQSGAVAKATAETTQKVTTTVRAQVQAEDRKQSAGLLDKMKVMLKPGTEIEYSTLDSTLAAIHEISFGKGGAVFTLANGQMWRTDDDDDWPSLTGKPVHVRIIPGSMGSFFMDIQGSGRPRVKFIGNVLAMPAPSGS